MMDQKYDDRKKYKIVEWEAEEWKCDHDGTKSYQFCRYSRQTPPYQGMILMKKNIKFEPHSWLVTFTE